MPEIGDIARERQRVSARGSLSGTTTLASLAQQGPPATVAESLGILKSVQSALVDVEVKGEILVDGVLSDSAAPAETQSKVPDWTSPAFVPDSKGKIASFDGKFVWRGTVTIQTSYQSPSTARDLSGYGRGTTKDDINQGNITLGFHEHCHQLDYRSYLASHPLPDPPSLKLGMKASDYQDAIEKFRRALQRYERALSESSRVRTDEVGYKKSTWLRTGKVFEHEAS